MVLYIILLVLSVLVPFGVNELISMFSDHYPLWYNIVAPVSIFIIIFSLDSIVATIIHKLPAKYFNYESEYYTVSKKERKVLDFLKVKDWKKNVPDMGQLCNFKKDKLKSVEKEYLAKFLVETCYAEAIHIGMGIVGFLVIIIWPLKDILYFSLPMAIINLLLNLPPVLIQRYNRPRLTVLYKRELSKDAA